MTRFFKISLGSLLACMVAVLSGCGEKPISVQTVPVENSGYPEFRKSKSKSETVAESASEVSPNRMVVAWFDRPDSTWFFKVNGPRSLVDGKIDQIKQFFGSVTFKGTQPEWVLPENWIEGPEKPMRFATLKMDGEANLEIAVSQLAAGQDRLLNVNRWLGQLSVPETSQEKIDDVLHEVVDADYLLFDAIGEGSGQMVGGSKAPFANAPFLKRMSEQANGGGPSDIDYTVPEGWTAKRVTGMVPGIKFTNTSAAPPVTITATRMPAAINTWLPNVQRWAGQVEVSLSEEQISQATEKIKIGDVESSLIKLSGAESEMIATLTVFRGDAWFFKLLADKDIVSKQEQTFREILKSIRFK